MKTIDPIHEWTDAERLDYLRRCMADVDRPSLVATMRLPDNGSADDVLRAHGWQHVTPWAREDDMPAEHTVAVVQRDPLHTRHNEPDATRPSGTSAFPDPPQGATPPVHSAGGVAPPTDERGRYRQRRRGSGSA